MTTLRKFLLGMMNEYAAKVRSAKTKLIKQSYRVSEIECMTLLAWEDHITLDWLRTRYGDYTRDAKSYREEPLYTDAKLDVIKRLAAHIKEEEPEMKR